LQGVLEAEALEMGYQKCRNTSIIDNTGLAG
jgi:hypothetical protein